MARVGGRVSCRDGRVCARARPHGAAGRHARRRVAPCRAWRAARRRRPRRARSRIRHAARRAAEDRGRRGAARPDGGVRGARRGARAGMKRDRPEDGRQPSFGGAATRCRQHARAC
ncbi:hypothetical protein BVI2075_970036 [Burkholderia vietnamiensis]|nr:hypothetical protein BVI2075_970036 [Burkholderia vietnamiensis]